MFSWLFEPHGAVESERFESVGGSRFELCASMGMYWYGKIKELFDEENDSCKLAHAHSGGFNVTTPVG